MIEFKKLNKQGLLAYINSEAFLNDPVIAISKHRAESQVLNPSLAENDILLFLAYEDENLVGYLGTLPDFIFTDEQEKIRCGWMSCLWVDPSQRGKKIAQNLIKQCFDSWDDKVLLTEFTAAAGNLYQKMGLFKSFHTRIGLRWYVRSDLYTILPPKSKYFNTLKPVLKWADISINSILSFKSIFNKPNLGDLEITYVNTIENDVETLINGTITKQTFKRTKRELEWLLQNPWVLTRPIQDEMAKKYHFTSFSNQFESSGIKINDESGKLVGFIIYSLRNGHLRIPYCYTSGSIKDIKTVISWLVYSKKIKTVTILQSTILSEKTNQNFLHSFHKTIKREYLISTYLSENFHFTNSSIQDGDGDCAFT